MTDKKDGGPAFPGKKVSHYESGEEISTHVHAKESVYAHHSGMSLRDWFAGMALSGTLANPKTAEDARAMEQNGDHFARELHKLLASASYDVAEAMLAERGKDNE